MPVAVILPKFTDMQEESIIAAWLVKEGDAIREGDPICEVETDKVNMEVEAPQTGRLAKILYAEGESAPVTGVIAYILLEGESEADLPSQEPQPVPEVSASPLARRIAQAEQVNLGDVTGSGPRGRITRADVETKIRATPAARHMARQTHVDLTSIPGSGPRGRIQRVDVEAFAGNGQMSTMRRTIAARMQSSWQNAPHIFFEVAVDGTRINGLREAAKKRLSVTAILIKACAWTLQKNPKLNATFENDLLILHPNANIGMAVALDDGLIVPTIRRAESLSLSEIQIQVDDLTERAHAGKLRLDDLAAGTFTVSNLGMRGVDRFTAIINPPQVAILAVGRMIRQFVPDEHDQPLVRPMMTLTLSVDHRVVDGADAAAFLEDLSAVLAEPSLLAW